jgi:hypothetical protein
MLTGQSLQSVELQCSDHLGSQFDLRRFERSFMRGSGGYFQLCRGVSWHILNQLPGVKIKSIPLGNKSAALSSAGINAAGFIPALKPNSKKLCSKIHDLGATWPIGYFTEKSKEENSGL